MQRTAIIGFGCGGYHTAKALREQGYHGEIHVYSSGDAPPANPMLTTYYVAGRLPYEGMFPFGGLEELSRDLALTLHLDTRVTALDSATRQITLKTGQIQAFDHIVLATGANALVPPLPGADTAGVYCMRTVEDAELLRQRLVRGVKTAVVIGASMVGIKLVELLHQQGVAVTLVDMAPNLFPTAALPEVASELEGRLTAAGVSLKFSCAISAIIPQGEGLEVMLGDGDRLGCDVVLLCIGTQANTQLADDGIAVGRGIVVNDCMQTGAPGIYAVGDCCEGNNLLSGQSQIIGLWDNAARQGHTAGTNIARAVLGQPPSCYAGNINHNITHFMDMDFIGLGDNRRGGAPRTFHLPDGGRIDITEENGKPVCINILDCYRISGVLKNYLLKRLTAPSARLNPTGRGRLAKEGVPTELVDYLEGLC